MGWRVDAMFAPLVEVLSYIKAGRLKALAVTTPERSFALPDVPAASEVFPGFEISLWNGILVPAGTPAERVGILNQAVRKAITSTQAQQVLHDQGSVPGANTPDEMRTQLASEKKKDRKSTRLNTRQSCADRIL